MTEFSAYLLHFQHVTYSLLSYVSPYPTSPSLPTTSTMGAKCTMVISQSSHNGPIKDIGLEA